MKERETQIKYRTQLQQYDLYSLFFNIRQYHKVSAEKRLRIYTRGT